jgi:hypothetical protein
VGRGDDAVHELPGDQPVREARVPEGLGSLALRT